MIVTKEAFESMSKKKQESYKKEMDEERNKFSPLNFILVNLNELGYMFMALTSLVMICLPLYKLAFGVNGIILIWNFSNLVIYVVALSIVVILLLTVFRMLVAILRFNRIKNKYFKVVVK